MNEEAYNDQVEQDTTDTSQSNDDDSKLQNIKEVSFVISGCTIRSLSLGSSSIKSFYSCFPSADHIHLCKSSFGHCCFQSVNGYYCDSLMKY
jgi:hypothetical protein